MGKTVEKMAGYQIKIRQALDAIKEHDIDAAWEKARMTELQVDMDFEAYKSPKHNELMDEWSDRMQGHWENQFEESYLYNDLGAATENAIKSGLFSKREIGELINPHLEKARKWFQNEKKTQRKREAESKKMLDDIEGENKRLDKLEKEAQAKKADIEKEFKSWEMKKYRTMYNRGTISAPTLESILGNPEFRPVK